MPSPIAHAGVYFLLRPALSRERVSALPRWRRVALMMLVLFALVAPDLDFVVSKLETGEAGLRHGMWVHSIAAAAVFAVPFAIMGRWISGLGAVRMGVIGFAAYASHVLLDAMTVGRGVMMWAPWSAQRVQWPAIFYGVRHDQPWNWQSHLVTMITEGLFVALLWFAARWARRLMPVRR